MNDFSSPGKLAGLALLVCCASCNAPESVQRAAPVQEAAAKELVQAYDAYAVAREELFRELVIPNELQQWTLEGGERSEFWTSKARARRARRRRPRLTYRPLSRY